MIPQKNQFSKVNEWDESEEEVIRVYSKEKIIALQQSDATKYRVLSPWKIILAQTLVTAISMVFWSIFGEPVGVTFILSRPF